MVFIAFPLFYARFLLVSLDSRKLFDKLINGNASYLLTYPLPTRPTLKRANRIG